MFEKPDSGLVLARMQLDLARKAADNKAIFSAYNTLAVGNKLRSDLSAALDYFNRCLEVARDMHDRGRMANTLSNMSTVYKDLGNQAKAIDLLQQSLRIDEGLGNKEGMAGTYNNIGNTYKRLNEPTKALENYQRSSADAGVDLVKDPDAMLDPEISARVLIRGLIDGRWNGSERKGVGAYLPAQPNQARRTVNGLDRALDVAGYYRSFLTAIQAAGGVAKPTPSAPMVVAARTPTPRPTSLLGRLFG